jgi:hypothetical protein
MKSFLIAVGIFLAIGLTAYFNRHVPDAPEKQAEPVAPKATPAAPKPVEPTER